MGAPRTGGSTGCVADGVSLLMGTPVGPLIGIFLLGTPWGSGLEGGGGESERGRSEGEEEDDAPPIRAEPTECSADNTY